MTKSWTFARKHSEMFIAHRNGYIMYRRYKYKQLYYINIIYDHSVYVRSRYKSQAYDSSERSFN